MSKVGSISSSIHQVMLTMPRQVGICLKHLPDVTDQPNAYYHNSNVPWQRVVNAKGGISPR